MGEGEKEREREKEREEEEEEEEEDGRTRSNRTKRGQGKKRLYASMRAKARLTQRGTGDAETRECPGPRESYLMVVAEPASLAEVWKRTLGCQAEDGVCF